MTSAVNFFRIFSRQSEPPQKPEAASHTSSTMKHLKTHERSDLPQSTLNEKRVVHHLNSFSAELSNFVLRILIERTLFQNTQIPYDMLIYLINDLIKILSSDKEETVNFAKECTILWKECRGQPLTAEERKYDEVPKNLNVTAEIFRGLSYSWLGQGLCTSLASAVGQGLWKHAPSVVGYFGLMMWGPKGVASAVNHVLQKSTLSFAQRTLLEPWLITIGRLALGFVPKVHATEKGVHYHYPSVQGSSQTFSPGQTVTVQGDRLSIERQGNFVTPEGSFEATASADFKLQQVMELNETRIKIRVTNDKGQSVPLEFIRVQGKYGPEVQVKCDDKTLEHYWNRYFNPAAKIAPPSDATLPCATGLTLGGLGSLVTSSPLLLATGGLSCLVSARAKPMKVPDNSCQGEECSAEQKNTARTEDRFIVPFDNKDELGVDPRLGVVNQKGKHWTVIIHNVNTSELEDLESITKVRGEGLKNRFITCRSGKYIPENGKKLAPICHYFRISESETGDKYEAFFIDKFQLPVPSKKALNLQVGPDLRPLFYEHNEIEGFALGPLLSNGKYRAYWAHRGVEVKDNKIQTNGITWLMQGIFDLNKMQVTAESVKRLQPPFLTEKGIQPFIKLRAITDLFLTDNNQLFATATIDTDNKKLEKDLSFDSRVYNMDTVFGISFDLKQFWADSCYVHGKKAEGLCKDSKNNWVIVLDNEDAGGEICTGSIEGPKHFDECFPLQVEGEKKQYGMSGIAILDN